VVKSCIFGWHWIITHLQIWGGRTISYVFYYYYLFLLQFLFFIVNDTCHIMIGANVTHHQIMSISNGNWFIYFLLHEVFNHFFKLKKLFVKTWPRELILHLLFFFLTFATECLLILSFLYLIFLFLTFHPYFIYIYIYIFVLTSCIFSGAYKIVLPWMKGGKPVHLVFRSDNVISYSFATDKIVWCDGKKKHNHLFAH